MLDELKKISNSYMTLCRTNIHIINLNEDQYESFNHFSMPKFLEDKFAGNIRHMCAKHNELKYNQTILYKDRLKMCYLIVILYYNNIQMYAIAIGPFLDSQVLKEEIKFLGHSMKLSSENIVILRNYYSKLPQYESEQITDIAIITSSIYQNKLYNVNLIKDIEKIQLPKENEYSNKFSQYDFVEQNYKRENQIMQGIEEGNIEEVTKLVNLSYEQVNVPARSKYNPLRDIKNLTITLNSVSTRASIRGGLNVHLAHSISTKYAVAIENQETVEGVLSLTPKLVKEYCKSVNDYSLKKYSPLIKKTLITIRKNISSSVSLSDIAAQLNTSKEHLCRSFKQEIGENLTNYIHKIKIQESLDLIKSKKYSVSEVAFMFGYSSSSYYSSVFKKVIGVSPKKYFEQINQ